MDNELKGLSILNTRPSALATPLTQFIETHGGKSIACPALEIAALPHTWIKALPDEPDMIVFISQHALLHSIALLKEKWSTWPTCASIGQQTTTLLEHHGIKVSITAPKADSESLISIMKTQQLNQKTVVIIKGRGGRPLLTDTLKELGANVIETDVYKRRCPESLPVICKNIWKNDEDFIILGTSIESVENLFTLFKPETWTWLKNTPWLVLSERIKDNLKSKGVKHIYLTKPDTLYPTLLGLKKLRMTS
jgi:uroporphyrinogen-III synthase